MTAKRKTKLPMPANLKAPNFLDNAVTVLERRYLMKDMNGHVIEEPMHMLWRVATTIAAADLNYDEKADVESLSMQFYEMLARFDFLPNSPTLMNAGRELGQLSACFVLPIEDSMDSIFEAVKQTALIHQSGGGTGFSFSRIRPKNDVVHSTKGVSSGPLSFMQVFDVATETIKQGGTRRGANMGIMRVDHPDIMDFIKVKADKTTLRNFNISVAITDKFMQALKDDSEYDLINPRSGQVVAKQNATKLFRQIVKQAWFSGEPGIVFIDRINAHNPTPQAGMIESTNPCGEQPLLPYESCNLGSINLANMIKNGQVDYDKLGRIVALAVHFLDNVVDVNRYPLPIIEQVTKQNRKIGLGVMGFADMLIQLGHPYSSSEAVMVAEDIMRFIDEKAFEASCRIGEKRGAFPNFDASIYGLKNPKQPVRNATRTTIAPTGTISILAGCSSGVEPLFAVAFVRRVMDNDELFEINPLFEKIARSKNFFSKELVKIVAHRGSLQGLDEIPPQYRRIFETAHDISPKNHIDIQAAFQKFTNNAVSKTINFSHDATPQDVEEAFLLAYHSDCKGLTIYRDGCRENQVLNIGKSDTSHAPAPSSTPASTPAMVKKHRPKILHGRTFQMTTGCGPMYVTINEDANRHLFEIFNTVGKAGGCAASQCEAIGRLVSLAWRSGMKPEPILKELIGISCHKPAGFGENRVTSCADAIARALRQLLEENNGCKDSTREENMTIGACPECGGVVEHEGGCQVCHACGYSECA